MAPTAKTLKIGGAWAGAATLVAALATAFVTVREPDRKAALARLAIERLEGEIAEAGRHPPGIDEPVFRTIVGTNEGVVAVEVLSTACVRRSSPGLVEYSRGPSHRASTHLGEIKAAGLVSLSASCRQSPDGSCAADPQQHAGWDGSEFLASEPDAEGYYAIQLMWVHGCRQRARWRPDGAIQRFEYVCCSHPQ